MSAVSLIIIMVGALAAGFIQTLSGFGAGTVMAIVFIQFFDPVAAPAMTLSVCFALTIYLSFKFRKYIEWRLIILPLIPYLIISTFMNKVMSGLDAKLLGILFGVFQILLAVYYLFVSGTLKPSKNTLSGIAIGSVSGATAALFGVGGPFLSLYMVAVSSSAKSYIANVQFFFVVTNIVIVSEKIAAGHYPADCWPYTLAGIIAIIIGARLGVILINKINTEKMKKIVYWFLMLSGLVTVFQNVL